MKTVSIVCEYNPFHTGHKYQLDKIKADFGEDTCIVAIMSGNFTQRGDVAIADKFTRARIAVAEGASLVLELPFPYCMQSAEFFARSAVRIIADCVNSDYISFGSECGDADIISQISENLCSDEYIAVFDELCQKEAQNGHAKNAEIAYRELFGKNADVLTLPNNILGIEYAKAIKSTKKDIKLHTFKRVGADHNDTSPFDKTSASASAIRAMLERGESEKAFSFLPSLSAQICKEVYEKGEMPASSNRLSNAILAFLRINPPSAQVADAVGGIEHRLHACSVQAKDLNELVSLVSTKRYTNARIRRAIWNSYFGITSSDIRTLPSYTQVLAMDEKGRKKLKEMKKTSLLSVLTKPADYVHLCDEAKAQAEISNRADMVFSLTKPVLSPGNEFLRATPFCKK